MKQITITQVGNGFLIRENYPAEKPLENAQVALEIGTVPSYPPKTLCNIIAEFFKEAPRNDT